MKYLLAGIYGVAAVALVAEVIHFSKMEKEFYESQAQFDERLNEAKRKYGID